MWLKVYVYYNENNVIVLKFLNWIIFFVKCILKVFKKEKNVEF